MAREPSPRRRPSEVELDLLAHLRGVTFGLGTPAHRFILDMHDAWIGLHDDFEMTERQLMYLVRIAWRYRRQITERLRVVAAIKGGTRKHGDNAAPGPVTPEQEQHILPF